jgi:diamine N-acetyltransferase
MGKRHLAPLPAGRIRLRLLEERDLPQTLAWRNQDHIRCWFFSNQRLTLPQHTAWFARYQQCDDDFVFIIEEPGGRPIGQVALYNVDWTGARAEFGRLMIGESDASGRGLAREAIDAIVNMAFEQLGLREVYLEVLPSNMRAIKIYKSCGFEITGRSEKAVRMGIDQTKGSLA